MSYLPLEKKKILFFCPKTFGYEKAIMAELQAMGATVTFHSDKPAEHPWSKGILRLMPKLGWYFADRYFFSWLKNFGPETCDFIFIIKGEGLSPNFFKTLRARYPEAPLLLHLWDSINNVKCTDLKLSFVTKFTSFDPVDCQNLKDARYRPLFFLNNYLNLNPPTTDNRVFFIGTLNGDRPEVISKVAQTLKRDVVFDYWLFVRSKLELTLRKIFDKSIAKLGDGHFIYTSMSRETITSYLNKCSAVLDIEHPKQTGLTMRTFEVIAAGKKLITTNKTIKNHDFYDPARIFVIDRNNPKIPADFFSSALAPLPDTFIAHYSLRGWLTEILLECEQ